MDMLDTKPEATGKREFNRIRNRSAILDAARECFRERGYDNTTIRDIVRRTGLAAGTFYNYFSSKQDIFAALLTDFLSGLNHNLTECRKSANSAEDFIYFAYLSLFRATASDPLVYELAHRNDRAIRELFGSDILGLAMLSLEDDVRNAVERGLLPEMDEEYLCAAFFGVGYELSLRLAYRAHNRPAEAEAEARNATRFATNLFLKGLERDMPLP
ncbi:helix-turn-helix domain-containing protein [Marinobacter salarius]|jgi:AcrR family transcriptional regulator|uniref:TetR/AcrR family transcriptional regulator n=1 Tax=Marinobacter TaxID=2742 RepID=UPI002359C133|nr:MULTISPECIES: TetR/AcrR family transcriptional regulator [Marinobacter]MDC8455811.1 TetR/AcrR family transcriptional regulator [Marinobacter sp. DS40M6]MDP4532351.1 helix-turn-helix domain-containing protein [Marinobacter salarius]